MQDICRQVTWSMRSDQRCLPCPLDLTKLEKPGGPVPVTEGVARGAPTGAAQFSFAANGTMVYFLSNTVASGETKVALITRDGKEKLLPFPPGRYQEPRISPDGKQAALVSEDEQGNPFLSVYDLSQATALRQLTFQTADYPVWTRDSQRIIFASDGTLFWQRADGTGAAEELAKPEQEGAYYPNAVSPDGKTLLFRSSVNAGDIWSLPLDGDHKPRSLISGSGNQFAAYFSPDGRWIVYASTEAQLASAEIYVQPFSTDRREVSDYEDPWSLSALVAGRKTDLLCQRRRANLSTNVIRRCSYATELWICESQQTADRQDSASRRHCDASPLRHHS